MERDVDAIRRKLRALADRGIAAQSTRFFQAAPGGYGAGDRFLGIRVPAVRRVARDHRDATPATAFALLRSPLHEERLCALLLLVALFVRGDSPLRRSIYDRYVESIRTRVNNWDLVDTSAPTIVGGYLEARSRRPLYRLARSPNLWERRVAMIATFTFIRANSFEDALSIAEQLLDDDEDLIHKAAGWMLREIGNRDAAVLRAFLRAHCPHMPRTMLRYAIEKLPPEERAAYLAVPRGR